MISSNIRRALFRIFLLLIALGGTVTFTLYLFVVAGFDGNATLPADCAVVFGAAVHPVFDDEGIVVSNVAGPGITRRVETAVALFQEGKIRRIFMTGGKGEGSAKSEAEVMMNLAVEMGIPPNSIVLETNARSTIENIRNTRPLTEDCESIVGISDRYHLARIGYMADREGWELSTLPAQNHPTALFEVKSVFREIAALIILNVPFYSR